MRKTDFSVFQAWTAAEDELRMAERQMAHLARMNNSEEQMLSLLAPLREKRATASRALQGLLRATAGEAPLPD